MKEIQEHKIKIYEFPDVDEDEDNKLVRKIKVMKDAVLFNQSGDCHAHNSLTRSHCCHAYMNIQKR